MVLTACVNSIDTIPRTPAGKPDLSGVWQAMGTAHWNLEPHNSEAGPIPVMGAIGAIPAGLGVLEDGVIPYREEAAKQRDINRQTWLDKDPLVKCYLPGVPRANYLPFPFQIVQSNNSMLITYEFAGADRIVTLNQPDREALVESWMGHNVGYWEGETLVIKITDQVPDTWFDHAGNFHSEALVVEERYTLIDKNTIQYRATMTDPKVFTKPWVISFPLYRRLDQHMQLLDFNCVEYAEELLYGKFRKRSDN